jgi:hypothetical protein
MHIGGRPYSPPDLRRLVAVGSTQFYHRREVLFCWSKNLFEKSKEHGAEERKFLFSMVRSGFGRGWSEEGGWVVVWGSCRGMCWVSWVCF